MEFFSVIIVLGLLQLWGSGGRLHRDAWFYRLASGLSSFVPFGRFRLVVLIALPVLIVLLLQLLFESMLFGLLSLILCIGTLLYGLGRGDLGESLQRYLNRWRFGNFESAYEQAVTIGDFRQSEEIADYVSLHQHVRKAYIYESFERWFAVVFWFLLLGPVGAVAYRLSYLAARAEVLSEEDRAPMLRFVHYLDWVPARLLALSFALAGNFVSGFNHSLAHLFDNHPAVELLDGCAVAAVCEFDDSCVYPADQSQFIEYGSKEMASLQSLLSRSVVCWLAVIALITLV